MSRYAWARKGDVNAFFGLMLDNVAVMIILVSSVSVVSADAAREQGKFTSAFVMTHMIPGTALGVFLGDLVYTAMAVRLARRSGRKDVTAMPLGLDTPSTFAVAFLVLPPALAAGMKEHADHERAMQFAWHVGLAVLVLVGVIKLIFAPLGNLVRRLVPRAGLLGSLAAIALVLIAFFPLVNQIGKVPLVGMISLLVILVALVAHRELPGRVPGALAAVLLGVALYHLGNWLGRTTGVPLVPPHASPTQPVWSPTAFFPFTAGHDLTWWLSVLETALAKLPVIFPFALATIVGGIDCTESAAAAGDDYDTRSILLTEAIASLVAGLLGGVIQNTPYIGHPAYKKMGGRAAYTLATALFIGAAGYFGWFTVLFAWLPEPAMFPILVFVGIEITAQSFHANEERHYPALALAMLPALAYLVLLQVNTALSFAPPATPGGCQLVQTLRCLANGFLLTSIIWAATLALILDDRLRAAAVWFGLAALLTLVGIMHSPLSPEKVAWPWVVLEQIAEPFQEAVRYQTPYHWAGAYGLMAGVLLVLDLWRPAASGLDRPAAELASAEASGVRQPAESADKDLFGPPWPA